MRQVRFARSVGFAAVGRVRVSSVAASSAQAPARCRPATVAPAVGRRCGEAGARAEPGHPDRAAESRRSQDVAIAQARAAWAPHADVQLDRTTRPQQPPTSALSGGQTKITDSRLSTSVRRQPDCCRPAPTTRSPGTARGDLDDQHLHRTSIRSSCSNVAFNITPAAAPQLQDRQHRGSSSRSAGRTARPPTSQLQSTIVADDAQREERVLGSGVRRSTT